MIHFYHLCILVMIAERTSLSALALLTKEYNSRPTVITTADTTELVAPLVPYSWPSSDTFEINLCHQEENNYIFVTSDLIENAVDNINLISYNSFFKYSPVYINFYNKSQLCPENSLYLYTVNYTVFDTHSYAYCQRNFMTEKVSDFEYKLRYAGCDIYVNTCILQSAASFYNVLLHELIHLIGLDHIPPQDDIVDLLPGAIQYFIRLDYEDDRRIVLQDTYYNYPNYIDIKSVRELLARDFPTFVADPITSLEHFVPAILPHKLIDNSGKDSTLQVYSDTCLKDNKNSLAPTPFVDVEETTDKKDKKNKNNKKNKKNKKYKNQRNKQNQKNNDVELNIESTPILNIDTDTDASYDNNIDITLDASPRIFTDLGAKHNKISIYSKVSPIIRIKKTQRKVGDASEKWKD